jgi:hypothetical protein
MRYEYHGALEILQGAHQRPRADLLLHVFARELECSRQVPHRPETVVVLDRAVTPADVNREPDKA